MPVRSGPQGVYFDLAEVRRISRALVDAYASAGAGSGLELYAGVSDKNDTALALYATDGHTHAVWCDDEQIFSGGTELTMNPVPPAMFGTGVFEKEAFFKVDGHTCRLSVDDTISSSIKHRVCVESTFDATRTVRIPQSTPPSYTYYGKSFNSKSDMMSLLTGMGMLYGFGESPGLICHKDRLEGITIGNAPGKFEIPGDTDCEIEVPMFFTLTRTFCYVTLSMMFASGILDVDRGLYVGVYDESAFGSGNLVFMHSGKCAIWCETEEQEKPNWTDYMPIAYVDQVKISQPSAFLMFSALASLALNSGANEVNFVNKPGTSFGGWIPFGKGALESRCEADLGSMPEFELTLTKNQVVAFSNTLGAAGEGAMVELILGDDNELIVSIGDNERWMIRLR